MLSDNDFDLLCKECGQGNRDFTQSVNDSSDFELPVLTESELTSMLHKHSAQDSVALNFTYQ